MDIEYWNANNIGQEIRDSRLASFMNVRHFYMPSTKGKENIPVASFPYTHVCTNDNSRVAERSKKYESCYEEYCKQKGWENFKSRNGEYVLIHTLSHMLIKEMAIQSGYSSSALHERIYSSDKMCGLLIYTGAADKEGSLAIP